ncbi:hypothetical protein A9Q99_19415 [Gammaproteobacteria bacterium 45_16_T64]|nr:hypothetical protein A9Q99_19415 [Gammaproteobacteria bacterium 45_16_T64]
MTHRYLLLLLLLCQAILTPTLLHAKNYANTLYPMVLVGGSFINFDHLGPIDFFYKIPSALRKEGADVFVSTVSAVNSPEVRGEQLARQVEDILALTGKEKVNLLSISSGGLTSRYTASVYPQHIASVTTINAGHAGANVADVAVGLIDSLPPSLEDSLWNLGDIITTLIAFIAGDSLPMDTQALAYSHTNEGAADFSRRHPEGMPTEYCGQAKTDIANNGVRYFAFAGSHHFTHWLDPGDYIFSLTQLLVGEPGDGVFGRCSSHWGTTIRDDLYLNHLDEANHLFGLRSPRLDPIALFLNQANRLKQLDL